MLYLYGDIVVAAEFEDELNEVPGTPLSWKEVYDLGLPEGFPYIRVHNPAALTDAKQVRSKKEIEILQRVMDRNKSFNEENFEDEINSLIDELRNKISKFDWNKVNEKPETDEKVEKFFQALLGDFAKHRHEYSFKLSENVLLPDIFAAWIDEILSKDKTVMKKSDVLSELVRHLRSTEESNYIYRVNCMASAFFSTLYLSAVGNIPHPLQPKEVYEKVNEYAEKKYPQWADYIREDFPRFDALLKVVANNESALEEALNSPFYYKKIDRYSNNIHAYGKDYIVFFIKSDTESDVTLPSLHVPVLPPRVEELLRSNGFVPLSNQLFAYKGKEEDAVKVFRKYFKQTAEHIEERKREERRNKPEAGEKISKEEFIRRAKEILLSGDSGNTATPRGKSDE